ncbi:hypothetical protein M2139_000551 [Enterococcus sp. PF1-24]|uniref:hypothetical protein n=1 Tax=unclassified Enterococcus TaxID=2608891 RepID=UPI00247646EC|nr:MULTISPECIES: hypothetical protein [unclassified Enterococcus]MDH6363714.1 hypothetical protein [Enterococcus sp. PFB1-1]MDH6400670.1 hypothetical protein [Enterococcus sp. PF1-24]
MELKKGDFVKGDFVKGSMVAKEPVLVEGEIISVLENIVIISTETHGNVTIKKSDLLK